MGVMGVFGSCDLNHHKVNISNICIQIGLLMSPIRAKVHPLIKSYRCLHNVRTIEYCMAYCHDAVVTGRLVQLHNARTILLGLHAYQRRHVFRGHGLFNLEKYKFFWQIL